MAREGATARGPAQARARRIAGIVGASVLAGLLGATSAGATEPPALAIYSTSGVALTPADVAARAAAADYLVAGEVHDNPHHHAVQAFVVEAVAGGAAGPPAVVLEMVPVDMADTLAWALDEAIATDELDGGAPALASLGAALRWDARGWPDWSMYAPVFAAAIEAGATIRAADLPAADLEAVGARGLEALAPDRRSRLALDSDLPPAAAEVLTTALVAGHCGLLPAEAIAPMVQVQRARDAALAEAMIEAPGRPAVLIAGAGHARRDHGAPYYLGAREPDAEILAIALVEVDDVADIEKARSADGTFDPAFDVYWFTPTADRTDHCAELEAMMKRRKDRADERP